MSKISPCNDCAVKLTCNRTTCEKWELWFRGYWRGLRRKYLGIAPGEESTDGK